MTTLQINKLKHEPTIDIKESVINLLMPMIDKAAEEWESGNLELFNTDQTYNALHGYTFKGMNEISTKLYNNYHGFKRNDFISQSAFNKLYKEHKIILKKGTKLAPVWYSTILFTKAAKDLLVKYGYKRSEFYKKVSKEDIKKMMQELSATNENLTYRFRKLSYVANVESFDNLLGTDNEKILKPNKNSKLEGWKQQELHDIKNNSEPEDTNFIDSILVNMESKPKILYHQAETAYYAPSLDTVNIRASYNMATPETWIETVLHELIHSTNHENRTNRRSKVIYSGHNGRSLEECIAEIGMLFSLRRFSDNAIDKSIIYKNAGAYLKSWLSKQSTDKQKVERLLTAARYAEYAEKYIFEPKDIKIVNKPIDKQTK